MSKGARHQMLVEGILNTPSKVRDEGFESLLRYLAGIAPHTRGDDIKRAIDDAADILRAKEQTAAFDAYCVAKRKVDAEPTIANGQEAGKAWRRFLDLFVPEDRRIGDARPVLYAIKGGQS